MAITDTVTVVFTDLVGSTELSSGVSARDADVLRQTHFSLLRAAVDANGGTEVKNLGDGLMVVFPSPSAALAGAVAMQQAVSRHDRRGPVDVPLAIRVGVSAGEVTVEDNDYFGDAVVEAARLCALAEGGEILATDMVRVLAGRRTPHQMTARGEHTLKGLPAPVAVFQVVWGPVSATAVPFPRRLAVPSPVAFVGRSRERDALEGWWKEAAAGDRRAAFLAGEAGVGKTRLATEVAAEAHQAGAMVLYGGCDEELGLPYRPWLEVLGHLVGHGDGELLNRVGERRLADLARVVPAVAERVPGVSPPVASDPETERYLFYAAVSTILSAAAEDAPVLVVLDDLHWADKPSVLLMRHVLTAPEASRLLVIGTYRDSEVGADSPLPDVLAALRREPGIHRLSLSGLDDAELTQFVVAAAGYDLGEAGLPFVQALYRETDGNPFFAWEVMQHLAESGAAARADDGTWSASIDEIGLPDSIREVVGRRVVRLGPDAERVLGLAAVIGTEWDLDLLAAAIHQPSDDLLDLLERAERAGLVRSAGPDRFGWAHTLIQHTLYGGLTAARRARAHRQVAEAIESVGTGGRSAELARHWAAAVAPAEAGKAVEYARQAGDEALAALAPDAAVRLYRQALELLAQQSSADDALRCELLCSLAEAQRQAGDGAFQDTRNAAARLARHLGDTDRLVRAVLTDYQRGYPANDPERVAHLEAALAAVGPADTDERGRLLGSLAFELSFTDPDRSAALWDESRAVALRVADLRALGQARRQMAGWVGFRAAWLDAGRKWQVEDHELAAAAEQLGDPDTIFDVAYAQYFNAEMSGDPAMRDDAYRRLRSVADELRRPDYRWIALYVEADMSLDRGDAARAERLVEEAFTIGRDTAQWGALTIYAAGLNNVRWFQGRRHEAASVVERAGRGDPALSLLHLETEAGGHALSEVVTRLPRDGAWLPAITVLAESAARRQDTQAARLIYEELLPHAHLFANATGIHRGSVALYLGMLATTMARYDEADRHFTAALAGEERLGAPFRVARTQLEWGRMLAAQGDAAGARQRLQAARDLAQRYGCAQVERRAERLLAGDAFKPD